MKVCSKCGVSKETSEFYKIKKFLPKEVKWTTVLSDYCKLCSSELSKINYSQNRLKPQLRSRERSREWRKNNPEKVKASIKRWRKNNPEKVKAICRKYQSKNKLKYKECSIKWNRNNPEASKNYSKHYCENLQNNYVISAISKVTEIPYKELKRHPDLINAWREQIRIKRIIKSIKKGEHHGK